MFMTTAGRSTLSVLSKSDYVRELRKLYPAGGDVVVINKTFDQNTCKSIWSIIKKNFPQTLHRYT